MKNNVEVSFNKSGKSIISTKDVLCDLLDHLLKSGNASNESIISNSGNNISVDLKYDTATIMSIAKTLRLDGHLRNCKSVWDEIDHPIKVGNNHKDDIRSIVNTYIKSMRFVPSNFGPIANNKKYSVYEYNNELDMKAYVIYILLNDYHKYLTSNGAIDIELKFELEDIGFNRVYGGIFNKIQYIETRIIMNKDGEIIDSDFYGKLKTIQVSNNDKLNVILFASELSSAVYSCIDEVYN